MKSRKSLGLRALEAPRFPSAVQTYPPSHAAAVRHLKAVDAAMARGVPWVGAIDLNGGGRPERKARQGAIIGPGAWGEGAASSPDA